MSLATARLSLRPFHPAHVLALIEEPARFEEMTGFPAAVGLRKMFTSAGISPGWLAALRVSPGYDPGRHGYFLVHIEAGAVIGSVGFKGSPDSIGSVEIAYGITIVDPDDGPVWRWERRR